MTVTYSAAVLNSRMVAVQQAIDAGGSHGFLNMLSSGGATMAQCLLSYPCGAASGGILTFTTPISASLVSLGGGIGSANITDSNGNIIVSGLSVGTSTASDIVMSNTVISSGNALTVIYATITGR